MCGWVGVEGHCSSNCSTELVYIMRRPMFEGNLHSLSWSQDGASATIRERQRQGSIMRVIPQPLTGKGHLPTPSVGLSSCRANSRLFLSERDREATQLRAPSTVRSFF